jgi:acetyl-CoA synthetase
MLTPGRTYEEVRAKFRWQVPPRFNIADAVCDRWAGKPDRVALIHRHDDGRVDRYSFADLQRMANRLANVLAGLGIGRGDRVGILLPQAPETAAAHIAAYKLGALAVPLFTLFQVEALRHRLGDSGAKAVITDTENLAKVEALRPDLENLTTMLVVGQGRDGAGTVDFHGALDRASDRFATADTDAEDPALIIYTSGTTGPPKGALHAHRVLLGHLPGIEFPHDFFPQPGDLHWTPADWAWIGGLLDVLLPSLYHGVPVLAFRAGKFDPEECFGLIEEFGIRNIFFPPTALKLMRQVPNPQDRWTLKPRTVASGGESLGVELLDWGRATFDLTIAEFYGQTECNLVVATNPSVMPVKPGAAGRPVPGHDVAIVDDAGNPLPIDALGNIAIRRPDPVMFLEYWRNPEATAAKFAGDWLLTGDTGTQDADGYIHYVGRDDDVITSAGYRIGPGEIEDCLMTHPAVALAAVIGVPDPVRTEAVKACVVLADGHRPGDDLAREIQDYVKQRLAAYEYPRLVEFLDALPMTTTGKIQRKLLREAHQAANPTPPMEETTSR